MRPAIRSDSAPGPRPAALSVWLGATVGDRLTLEDTVAPSAQAVYVDPKHAFHSETRSSGRGVGNVPTDDGCSFLAPPPPPTPPPKPSACRASGADGGCSHEYYCPPGAPRYPARPRASALPPLLSPPLSRPPFDPLYRRRPHAPVRSSYGRDPGVRGAPGNPPSRWRTTAEYMFFMEDALLSLLPSSRPATPSKCACNGPPRPTTLVFKPTTPLSSFFPPSLGEPVKGAPCALLDHKSSWRLSVFPLDLDTCTPVHIAPPCAQNRSPAWLAAASLTPGSPAPPY